MWKSLLLGVMFAMCLSTINAQTTVKGKLFGHDGKPLKAANIFLMKDGASAVKSVQVGKDGSYSFLIDTAGVWTVRYTGVDHYMHDVLLFVEGQSTVGIDVRLKGYEYAEDLSGVKVVGDFNNFSFESAVPLQKGSDGRYALEFKATADSLAYQLIGVEKSGRSINGTNSTRYAYDGGGDYKSIVIPVNGIARIIFDTALIVRASEPAFVKFVNPDTRIAKMSGLAEDWQRYQEKVAAAETEFRKSGKDISQFRYDASIDISEVKSRLDKETDSLVREGLLVNYLELCGMSGQFDSSETAKTLARIPPSSPAWSIDPNLILRFGSTAVGKEGSYFDRYISENPDESAKASLVFNEFIDAKYNNQREDAAKYYDILVNQLKDTPQGKRAKLRYVREGKIGAGMPVPDFSIKSFDDSTRLITNESLLGKTYIVDFWATWCGPCVGEMKHLHDAYNKFKDKGFIILSISLDASPADVIAFRKDKWPMPWLHAFVGDWENTICKDFDVVAIPRPVLVDSKGKIVAMNNELRGAELDKTLERILGK
ncbi:MAG TPA: thioredoxin-like domain-containing protein [Candidatus Kryptonia bacterium]